MLKNSFILYIKEDTESTDYKDLLALKQKLDIEIGGSFSSGSNQLYTKLVTCWNI